MSSSRRQKPCELSLIVSIDNETENIPELIERVEKSLKNKSFEAILVDDKNEDETADIAEKLNTKYGNINVLRRNGRLKLRSAVVDDIRASNEDLLVVMDVDLQCPLELLPRMLEEAEKGFDIVIASRYVSDGGVEGVEYPETNYTSRANSSLILFSQRPGAVKDPVSGFFLVRRSVIDGVAFSHADYNILLEILVKGRGLIK